MPNIEIQRADQIPECPGDSELIAWATAALPSASEDSELCIRIVDATESRALNQRYRQRDYATNVLSFSADLPPGVDLPLLGDIVICAPVVIAEAQEQKKSVPDHWAHMVVHGVLHLLGYDHENEPDAERMEAKEIGILNSLGIADPYTPAITDPTSGTPPETNSGNM